MINEKQKFLLPELNIRGAVVGLSSSWQEVITRRAYPSLVESWLGQASCATLLMAASMKIDGELSLQIQSDGYLKYLVVQTQSDGGFRSIAKLDDEAIPNQTFNLQSASKNGVMLISLAQKNQKEPYKAMITIDQASIADNIESYFYQSEQLKTFLRLDSNHQFSAGIMLQAMPDCHASEDDWQRLRFVMDTLNLDEYQENDTATIINRLFAEEDRVVYEPERLFFNCICSSSKTLSMLSLLEEKDLQEILEQQEEVIVGCDFCGKKYSHDLATVHALIANKIHPN